jgi:pSer/pThr/pTyr-binding forkhead associated (FHA) protein
MEMTLFFLRLLAAFLLIVFMGGMAWVMISELRTMTRYAAGPSDLVGQLLVLSSDVQALKEGQQYPLKPVTGIGRGLDNTIVIDDDFSSMHHALLTLRGQQWWLEDLHSSNGTLLNNEPISQKMMVSSGDNITVGSTVFRLEI